MPVPCAHCEMPLPSRELSYTDRPLCTVCGSQNEVRVFPAILQASAGASRAEAAIEGEAACFDHPRKRAVGACKQCGRFVCPVCSVEFAGEVWCPSCVAAGAGAARAAKLETSRPLYDSIVLGMPLWSLLIWPLTLLTAPAALVLGLVKWSQPISVVRRSRWRMALGMIIAAAETGAWVFGFVYILNRTP
jgi:hypothetical protein